MTEIRSWEDLSQTSEHNQRLDIWVLRGNREMLLVCRLSLADLINEDRGCMLWHLLSQVEKLLIDAVNDLYWHW